MDKISRNISIALRAERLIAQRQVEVIRTKTVLIAAAGLVAGIGLIMLNVAAYYALTTNFSPQIAALIVALVNLALAIILGIYAGRINADSDVQGATEVRNMAIEDLKSEIGDVSREVKEIVSEVRQFAKNPLGGSLSGIVGPFVVALLRSSKKGKTPEEKS
ncbi:MAG: phage holin family protein [Rhizobiaceae bacterium]